MHIQFTDEKYNDYVIIIIIVSLFFMYPLAKFFTEILKNDDYQCEVTMLNLS